MSFLKVAWRDISSIFNNRFIRVSVIAIIIVPLLYSLLYLDAFWNPYARIKDMPVAVVNQDKGSIKDGMNVNYGEDLVKSLKEKQAVGWRFVTRKQAEDGLKGKEYYAMYIIPENFSQNALSSTKGKPEQAKILYSANEKRNFLAAQINGKILDQIKAELTKSMSEGYTIAVFDSLYEVKDGMKKASDGSKELSDGLVIAKDGTSDLKDGVAKLNNSVPEMINGVDKLLVGSNILSSKLGELKSQVPTMGTGVQKLNGAYKTQIVPATLKLKDGASQLSLGLDEAKDGVNQLSGAAMKLNEGGAQLTVGSGKLTEGYGQMKIGIISLKDASLKVSEGVDALLDNSKKSQVVLAKAVDSQLGVYLKDHPEAMQDANMQSFLATLSSLNKASADDKNLEDMKALQIGAHKVSAGAEELQQGSAAFVEGSKQFAQSTVVFAKGSEEFSKGAGNFAEKTAVAIGAAKQISGGLDTLYGAMSGEFGNGLSELDKKMPVLVDATSKLSEGSAEITKGISTLNGKLPDLKEGVNKLYSGTDKLDSGMTELASGSKELNDKLTKGYNDLSSSLKNDSKTMAATFSEPVVIDDKPVYPVKTYGEGFTPYFIPLSLWVGALMMFFVITDKVDSDITASPAAVVVGKFMSYGAIGFVQAVLASGIVLALGLRPNNILLYFLFNILLSNVFIAIIQCMIFLLGQVGRLLSIILLILQLTSCAGTFPIEVVPKFFKVLNPFMPFTYAVSGLREIISGGDYLVFTKDVIVLAAMLFAFLFISVLMKGHADKVQKLIQDRKEKAEIVRA